MLQNVIGNDKILRIIANFLQAFTIIHNIWFDNSAQIHTEIAH
jgi:hypothetical protein